MRSAINHQQLQDLQGAQDDSDTSSEEKVGKIPSFNPRVRLKADTPHQHKYATQSKAQPPTLVKSTIAGMGKDQQWWTKNLLQSVDHCPANMIIESTNL